MRKESVKYRLRERKGEGVNERMKKSDKRERGKSERECKKARQRVRKESVKYRLGERKGESANEKE